MPDWESLPYDVFSPHQDIISQRLETLYRLPGLTRGVVLASVSTLLHRLPPRDFVTGHSFLLKLGDRLDIQQLREQLIHANYHNVSQVMEPGEFAVRGGLVDVFPMGSHAALPHRPVRRSGGVHPRIRSGDAAFRQNHARHAAAAGARIAADRRGHPALPPGVSARASRAIRRRCRSIATSARASAPAGIEYYLPLFFPRWRRIFDYLPEDTLCVIEAGERETARTFWQETEQRYQRACAMITERPVLEPPGDFH